MTHKKTDEGYPIFRSYLETENDEPYYSMNTLSFYYEDMARKQKLIEDLAKAIAGYDQTLTGNLQAIEQKVAERFDQWDEKLKTFDGSVMDLLQEWVDDGTMDHIVDSSIVDRKLEPITAQLAEKVGGTIKAKMEDLSDEVISAVTGGATVNVLSIPQDGSVSPEKTNFFYTAPNILDKNSPDMMYGKMVNGYKEIVDIAYAFLSHKIPAKSGDKFLITYDTGFNNTIGGYFDDAGNVLGIMSATPMDSNRYREFTLPQNANIAYVRLQATATKIDTIMIIKNGAYPATYVQSKKTLIDGISLNETQKEEVIGLASSGDSPLYGKVFASNGDSIAAAVTTVGYAKMIADKNNMLLENIAVNGGTITGGVNASSGSPRHWVSRTISNMRADADYVILEGGVNDGALEVPMGTISIGYTAVLDDTTFCGALESTFKQAYERFPESKIGFIIVHKIFDETRYWTTNVYPAIKKICEKWGVPYIDLSVQVPPLNFIAHLKTTYTLNGDGWHPNELGYRLFYLNKIEEWMKSL